MKTLTKAFILVSLFAFTLNSCKKDCYTCKAENFGNLVDFDENCGTDEEKTKMEEDFRIQYPDSLYFVRCD